MGAIISSGALEWGMQLPIQSQSSLYVQPWERSATPADLAAVSQAADRGGAFYVAVCDHVAIPDDRVEAMGATWYDTIATLGWLAAQTERVNLLSHVYVAPYRHPLVAAKSFATLDVLSHGRAILGVGIGHVEAEFEQLGVPFRTRGKALDAALPVLREALATGRYDGAVIEPRSLRPDGPPIWVGGSSDAALRRAATLADGWLPQGPPPMGFRGAIELLHRTRAEVGLDAAFDVGMMAGSVYLGEADWALPEHTTATADPGELAAKLARFCSIGANQLQVRFAARSSAEMCEQIERFGAEVWPEVQHLVVG
ncbi:MAG: LLM class flavin-dependent oxidoreductase [Actinobacteria bacterium]|nr:LLM class flavin-dependent oxidoreductase [Actinomycetota bacterium]